MGGSTEIIGMANLNAGHAMDYTLGFIFLGVIINVWLYGFSVVQTYLYFTSFPNDKRPIRIFIAVLFLADTLNSVLDCHFVYVYLISNFGNVTQASRAVHTFSSDPILTSVIALMAQSFFAWRIYKLTQQWWTSAAIIFIGGLSLLAAIGTTVGVEIVVEFAKFQKFQVAVIIWLACAAVADGIITTALILTLNKSRTGFSQTDDVITKLIRLTLQTGLLTASVATIDLILFLASTTTAHLLFNLPLAKLYVNSLLSTLNARAVFADRQRYTMNGSSADGRTKEAGLSHVNGGLSGGSRVRHSRFNPTGSADSTISAIEAAGRRDDARGTTSFFRKISGSHQGRSSPDRSLNAGDVESGVRITTVEERFEDPPSIALQQVPQLAARRSVEERRFGNALYGADENKSTETAGSMPRGASDEVQDSNDARHY